MASLSSWRSPIALTHLETVVEDGQLMARFGGRVRWWAWPALCWRALRTCEVSPWWSWGIVGAKVIVWCARMMFCKPPKGP
jgi:hypothetical protein